MVDIGGWDGWWCDKKYVFVLVLVTCDIVMMVLSRCCISCSSATNGSFRENDTSNIRWMATVFMLVFCLYK